MSTQLTKLDTLLSACGRARMVADKRMLFASPEGLALVKAAADLFEVDGLFDLADDVRLELGLFDDEPVGRAAA